MRLEPAICVNCGADDCTPVAVGADFEYATSDDEFLAVQCRKCTLVYLNPRPDAAGLRLAYPDNYHAFQFSSSGFGLVYQARQWLEARRLLRWCRNLPANAKILDVGCGDGFHLELLRKFGSSTWITEGIDADPRAVAGAERRGVRIQVGELEVVDLPKSSYDLIFLIMTIEHLPDPVKCLTRVRQLLRPMGKLIVVTDNTESPDFRLFGNRHWGGYHFPRHLYLFNRRNLSELCGKVGLETVSVRTAVSPVNWTYSIRNLIQDWGGPTWIRNIFSLESPVALALFTVMDYPLSWLGKGAILHGEFIKSGESV